ncbi:hypothetical protein PENTCL1PPCAC_30245 [Pristionchus entomophagus]|uniref:NR LBD domain-containing protein n=2 Tax=Pristionchus entomophagus TaxID=358040 RepID=A0AAV5ULV6_9BILA|nr:hypothetical protein PENTCL1PPCAC_30245 [Pristionchus entomophagus]
MENRKCRTLQSVSSSLIDPFPHLIEAAKALTPTTNAITRSFISCLEGDFSPEDELERAVPALIKRVKMFASGLPGMEQLCPSRLSSLCASKFFGVQLFRLASTWSEEEQAMKPREGASLTSSLLSPHLPPSLISALFSHAETIAELELTDQMIAVMAALMVAAPGNEIDSPFSHCEASLFVQLYGLVDRECDEVPMAYRWPKYLALVHQFRRDSDRILTSLSELSNEGSRLFANLLSI